MMPNLMSKENTIFNPNKEYLEVLDQFLLRLKGTPYYERVRNSHLNSERFLYWIGWIERYKPIENTSVLDLGCGSGGMLIALSYRGAKATGIEVDPSLYSLAKARLKNIPNTEVLITDGKLIPFPDNSFDIITSIHVLEHVKDLNEYFNELYRVLKVGGVALIECPNRFYPIEPHTELKFITLFPRKFTNIVSIMLQNNQLLSRDTRLKFKGINELSSFISYFTIRKILANYPTKIIEFNPTERFKEELKNHFLYTRFIKNNYFSYKILRSFSHLFSRNVLVIFEKKLKL